MPTTNGTNWGRFRFDDEQYKRILVAITKELALKNNPHANNARHDRVRNVVHGEVTYNRFTYLPHALDPALSAFFIRRLEIEIDRCRTERELKKTVARRQRGRPPKHAERRLARQAALLCRDLLEIEPTKGRNYRGSDFAQRGGFFAKILEISLESADLGRPDEIYRLLKHAVNALPVRQIDDPGLQQRPGKHKALALRDLDKLEGLEYEAALALLTPEQEQRYLAQEQTRKTRPKRTTGKKSQRTTRITSRKRTIRR